MVTMLVLAGCGAPGKTPADGGVRPGDGGATSGAEGTATPDAPTATPTPTTQPTATPTVVLTPTPTPVINLASASAAIDVAADGGYEVVVSLGVTRVGLSGVDIRVTSLHSNVTIDGVSLGTALGTQTITGSQIASTDGTTGRLAYARKGTTPEGDAGGQVAVVRVTADDEQAIHQALVVEMDWTDAGLKLHGPITAPVS